MSDEEEMFSPLPSYGHEENEFFSPLTTSGGATLNWESNSPEPHQSISAETVIEFWAISTRFHTQLVLSKYLRRWKGSQPVHEEQGINDVEQTSAEILCTLNMDQDHLDSHDLALLLAQFRSAMAEVLRVSRRSVDILRVVDLRIAFRLKYLPSWIPRHRIPVHIEEELSTTGGPVFKLIGGSLKTLISPGSVSICVEPMPDGDIEIYDEEANIPFLLDVLMEKASMLQQSEEQITALQKITDHMEDQRKEAEDIAAVTEKVRAELKQVDQEAQRAKEERDHAEKSKVELEKRVSMLQTERDTSIALVKKVREETSAAIEAAHEQGGQRIASLEAEIMSLRSEVDDLQQQTDRTAVALDQAQSDVETATERENAALRALAEANKGVRDAVSSSSAAEKRAKKADSAMENANREAARLRSANADLQAEVSHLRSSEDELNGQLAAIRGELAALTQISEMKVNQLVAAAEAAGAAEAAALDAATKAREETTSSELRIRTALADVRAAEAKADVADKAAAASLEESLALREKVRILQDERSATGSRMERQEEALTACRLALQSAEKREEALEASLSEALSRVENLEHAQSVAAAARGDASAAAQDAEMRAAQALEDALTASSKSKRLEKTIDELTVRLEATKSDLEDSKTNLEELKKENEALTATTSQMAVERRKMEELHNTVGSLTRERDAARMEATRAHTDAEAAIANAVAAAKQRNHECEEELETLHVSSCDVSVQTTAMYPSRTLDQASSSTPLPTERVSELIAASVRKDAEKASLAASAAEERKALNDALEASQSQIRQLQARCEELELNRRAAEETTEAVRSRVRVAEADLLEARQSLATSEKAAEAAAASAKEAQHAVEKVSEQSYSYLVRAAVSGEELGRERARSESLRQLLRSAAKVAGKVDDSKHETDNNISISVPDHAVGDACHLALTGTDLSDRIEEVRKEITQAFKDANPDKRVVL